jgi:hypothetical protein
MKESKLSIQQKNEILVSALNCYIEKISKNCNALTGEDKNELRLYQWEVEKVLKIIEAKAQKRINKTDENE